MKNIEGWKVSPKGVIFYKIPSNYVEKGVPEKIIELLKKPINWRIFCKDTDLYFYLVLNGKIKELEEAGFPKITLQDNKSYYTLLNEILDDLFRKSLDDSVKNKKILLDPYLESYLTSKKNLTKVLKLVNNGSVFTSLDFFRELRSFSPKLAQILRKNAENLGYTTSEFLLIFNRSFVSVMSEWKFGSSVQVKRLLEVIKHLSSDLKESSVLRSQAIRWLIGCYDYHSQSVRRHNRTDEILQEIQNQIFDLLDVEALEDKDYSYIYFLIEREFSYNNRSRNYIELLQKIEKRFEPLDQKRLVVDKSIAQNFSLKMIIEFREKYPSLYEDLDAEVLCYFMLRSLSLETSEVFTSFLEHKRAKEVLKKTSLIEILGVSRESPWFSRDQFLRNWKDAPQVLKRILSLGCPIFSDNDTEKSMIKFLKLISKDKYPEIVLSAVFDHLKLNIAGEVFQRVDQSLVQKKLRNRKRRIL